MRTPSTPSQPLFGDGDAKGQAAHDGAFVMSGPDKKSSQAWKPPTHFEEYRVLSPLSKGGMGEVFLGHDTLLDRAVAIKFIGAQRPDEKTREQFLTEARAAA